MKALSASSHVKNVLSRPFRAACAYVCVCERTRLQTHKERAEQHFFMGPLAAEGPKPQALPRPTLLCNSCPEAIMHGACQTGPALSHHHTFIQALYHIHERPLEQQSRLAWLQIKIHTRNMRRVSVAAGAGGRPRGQRAPSEPPSGAFASGLCFGVATVICCISNWCSRGYQQFGFA